MMESLLIVLLIFLAVFLYSFIAAITAGKDIKKLRQEIEVLQHRVRLLESEHPKEKEPSQVFQGQESTHVTLTSTSAPVSSVSEEKEEKSSPVAPAVSRSQVPLPQRKHGIQVIARMDAYIEGKVSKIKENWLVWLGGICVGLAGIFMVKYGVDQGLITPLARVGMALVTGLGLHGLAELLRRRYGGHDALAGLAGGASLTLFAALLAAFHLYELLPATFVFIGLVIISLVTMSLALVHGPVLAVLGLLGAYTVPILVNTGGGSYPAVLVYIGIVTFFSLVLIRYVYRVWLWLGIVGLSLLWWFIGLVHYEDFTLVLNTYLGFLAYVLVAVPSGDWLLQHTDIAGGKTEKNPFGRFICKKPDRADAIFYTYLLFTLLQGLCLAVKPLESAGFYSILFLPIITMILARKKGDFALLGWTSFVVNCVALLSHYISYSDGIVTILPQALTDKAHFFTILFSFSVCYIVLSLINLRAGRHKGIWASLAVMVAPIMLAMVYVVVPEFRKEPFFIAPCLLLGVLYLGGAFKLPLAKVDRSVALVLIIGGHFSYSLAAVFAFDEASLSLALSVQFISLAWLRKEFGCTRLDWVIKAVAAVVVARLTFNPFIIHYATGTHWTLWTYGGAFVCAFLATRILPPKENIRLWLEGTCLHLFVLFFATESRYWLYDGAVFVKEYSALEASLNTLVWGSVGLIYNWRMSLTSGFSLRFYKWASIVFLGAAALNHVFATLIYFNPVLTHNVVGSAFLFNILLPSYGLPVLLLALAIRQLKVKQVKWLGLATGLSFVLFVSMEVRHFYTPEMYHALKMSNAEIYTYSLLWLCIAIGAIFGGAKWRKHTIYQGGMSFLLVVVAKIFLIDMSALEGLFRVASFMGLGLCLLGIAFLHRWFSKEGGVAYKTKVE